MASPPENAPPGNNTDTPPADEPPALPPPPPESQTPPESPPPSPPASPPPSPPSSSPPPPDSATPPPSGGGESPQTPPPSPEQPSSPPSTSTPPLSSTTPSTPPTSSSTPSVPAFSPPTGPQTPPSLALPPPPPRGGASSAGGSPITDASSTLPTPSSSNSSANVSIIAGVLVGGLLIVLLVVCSLMCSKRKRKPQYYVDPHKGSGYNNGGPQRQPMDHVVKIPPPPLGGSWGPPSMSTNSNDFSNGSGQFHVPMQPISPNMMMGIGGKSQFAYEDLASATGGFSQANLLGQGGFGFVHKGVLSSGKEVAVKSLKSGSGQGEREFQAEVEIINRVHHRHLVSLIGYCIAGDKRMLVYEFVPNNTLEFHLHGKGQPVMDWTSRLRIALGSAKGLAYLHEDCHPRIIHRDIKAANILIDNNFEAMVADFGLAKLTTDNYTHVSTRVMGTFGYLAPEYAASGKLTEKSDVFSFGVMLLEIITGRRPIDPTNVTMEDSLVDWARPLLTKALEDGDYSVLVDPLLEGEYAAHEMGRMIASAAACIRHSARRRPRMSQIVRALEGNASLDDLNEGGGGAGKSSGWKSGVGGQSLYDTGAYNADMIKFRKMVLTSQEDSSDFGDTSEYGLNPSSSSSGEDSTEMSINGSSSRKI